LAQWWQRGAVAHLSRPASPIGAARVGVVVQRAGLVPTVLGMGAISLLVTLGMFFNRSLRQMDTREPRPDTSPVVK
jgi:hypothetical protein